MKLSTKCALSMGSLMVLMAILGIFLIRQMTRINDAAAYMAEDRLPLIHSLGVENKAVSGFRVAQMLHVLVDSKDEKAMFSQRMSNWNEIINANVDTLDKLIKLPEGRQYFNEYQDALAKYRQQSKKIIEFSLSGQGEEALKLLLDSIKLYYMIGGTLENITTIVLKDTATINSNIDEMYANALTISIASVICAVLIAVALTILLVRNTITQLGKDPGELNAIAKRVVDGDYNVYDGSKKQGVYGAIVEMVSSLKHHIETAEQESENAKEQSEKAKEAMEQANIASKEAQDKTKSMLLAADKLERVANIVSSSSTDLSAKIEQAGRGAEQQASVATDTATAMEEMTATVLEVAKNASTTFEVSAQTRQKAEEGSLIVHKSVQSIQAVQQESLALKDAMGELSEHAQSINQIMSVISDIADQTNLLALNAAIEAARAGEAGRGFAVVADEVRKLAEKTMASTIDVGNAITAIQESANRSTSQVDRAVSVIEETTAYALQSGEALSEIVTMADQTAAQVQGIAAASEQQSAASEEINRSVNQVNSIAAETVKAMDEAAQDISSLAQQAHGLTELIADMKRG